VGSFIEDFLNGGARPQTTGESSWWETPARIATASPLNMIGPTQQQASQMFTNLDSWLPDQTTMGGRLAALPLTMPRNMIMGGLTALEFAESNLFSRPVSTGLQGLAVTNPLYRDGVQVQDFLDMWDASEYISPGRAGVTNIGSQLGMVEEIARGRTSSWNRFSMTGSYNPYPTTEGGSSPEAVERRWDESLLGTVGSTSFDTAFQILAGGKGLNSVAASVKRGAGLSTQITNMRDLTKLGNSMDSHAAWVASEGAQGRKTFVGRLVQDLVDSDDIYKIRSNPLLWRWTSSGSYNRDTLATLISQTDDYDTVKALVLADRGDPKAIGQLFQSSPDRVWALSDMNESMQRQFATGGQFVPDEAASRKLATVFDTAIERDEFFTAVRDMLVTADTPGSEGMISAFRGRGSDFMPLGASGLPGSEVFGWAERWVKSRVSNARINAPNQWHEIPLSAEDGTGPVTKMLFWAGNQRPLNMVSYSRMRPDEVVDEMIAYSRSSRALRSNTFTVSRKNAEGVTERVVQPAYLWRADAVARLSAAKSQGDAALDATVRDLQDELVSHVVNKYEIPPAVADVVVGALRESSDIASAQVVRDGFFWNEYGQRVLLDPVTRRQLADSTLLMPMDDLDWALRIESTARYGTKGRKPRAVLNTVQAGLDFVYRWFRINVLIRPGYVPKNSFAEPAVASILADASLIPEGGLGRVGGRFARNMDRRADQLGYWLQDHLPKSKYRKNREAAEQLDNEYSTLLGKLDELDQLVDDLDSAGTSPATRARHLQVAQRERKAVYRQVQALEREMGLSDGGWRQVDEVPTYSVLKDRVENLRVSLTDPEFPTLARTQLDELAANAKVADQAAADLAGAESHLASLSAKRERLEEVKRSLFKDNDQRAANRRVQDPNRNQRRDLADVEPDERTLPSGRRIPSMDDVDARVNDPRDTTNLSRYDTDWAGRRRYEAVIRTIKYLDDEIATTQRDIKTLTGLRDAPPLSPAQQAKKAQLEAQLAAREGLDGDPTPILDDLARQLDEIREETFTLEPTVLARKKALEARLAELDGARGTLADRIGARELARSRARDREFSGEEDFTINIDGDDYSFKGAFSEDGDYGAAMRAEMSADLTAQQTATAGAMGGGPASGSRWRATGESRKVMPSDPLYWDELTYVANRHVKGDPLAALILEGESPAKIMEWFRKPQGKKYMRDMGWTPEMLQNRPVGRTRLSGLAQEQGGPGAGRDIPVVGSGIIEENTQTLLQYFPDPAVRARLLDGDDLTPGELMSMMGGRDDLSPLLGKGLDFVGNWSARVGRATDNATNKAWSLLAAKPESRFGRWPFFQREYRRQLTAELEFRRSRGDILDAAALEGMKQQAKSRALKQVENTFYNIRRMNNAVYALRYVMGFPAAAYNTAYRYARLGYRKPGSAMVMANTWTNALESLGVDSDGNKVDSWENAEYIVLNVPTEWGLPIDGSVRINSDSVNLGTQETGTLPTLSAPVSMLIAHKPNMADWAKKNIPDVYEAMFPFGADLDPDYSLLGVVPLDPFMASYQRKGIMWIRSWFSPGGIKDKDFLRVAIQDWTYRLSEWQNNGQRGSRPTYEESAANAGDYYRTGALLSWLGPGSVQSPPLGQKEREDWFEILERNEGDYPAAVEEMRALHGEGAWYIMQGTSNNRGNMPATQDAKNILDSNPELANMLRDLDPDDPRMTVGLLFLDEQTYSQDEFSPELYDWMFQATLPGDDQPIMSKRSAVSIDDKLARDESWAFYNKAVAKRDGLMAQYGYTGLSPDDETAWLYQEWNTWEQQFRADPRNAQWLKDLGEVDRGRSERAVIALDRMLGNEAWMSQHGDSPTWRIAAEYRTNLDNARTAIELADSTEEKVAIAASWDAHVRKYFLPEAPNFAGYYEQYLAGRDLTGLQLLETDYVRPQFPIPASQ
jgi:hypothetical protein